MSRGLAQALVSAVHRLALAALALEAAVDAHHSALAQARRSAPAVAGGDPDQHRSGGDSDPLQAQLDQFAGMVRQASAQLAEALRRMGPPGPLPPLREVQARIPRDQDGSNALFVATDSLVDALNTAADIMRRYLAPPNGSGRDPVSRS